MTDRIVMQFNMQNSRPCAIPLPLGTILEKKKPQDVSVKLSEKYWEIIGCTLYLSNTTRPDISFVVGVLSRYLEDPTVTHWKATLHVLRYLNHTRKFGIRYCAKDGFERGLIGYCDSDFGGDRDKWKSMSGFVFMIAGGAVSWSSKEQSITALSTVGAEFISLSFAVRESPWLCRLYVTLSIIDKCFSCKITVDNQGCVAVA